MDQPSITSPDLLFSEKISGFKKRNKILVKTRPFQKKNKTHTHLSQLGDICNTTL